tara:strand:+ start:37 stop:258 length:222 start_codon:yes stop_codon:yes gene_type:complete
MKSDPMSEAVLILQSLKKDDQAEEPPAQSNKDIALDSAMRRAYDAAKGDDYRAFGSALIDLLDIHRAGGGLDA